MAFRKLTPMFKIVAYTESKKPLDNKIIAEATGYSVSHVCNTLRGRRNNIKIVNTAYRLVRSRATNLEKLTSA